WLRSRVSARRATLQTSACDATEFGSNPDGSKFLKLLWNSHQIDGNKFRFSKFCPPVVANGKVYVTTYDGRVDVYGP
ncbi:MAG TPA: PQQ-binding-like beta-propeller repeat protein, partial [Planctomycetaceae bacterium]|nr:PQQ-binding-like beta-propeller repeat protein [Planctomycetaceae bacterium]